MKNKAKYTALLMCSILLLSGCGSVDDKDSAGKEDIITQTTDAPDETPAPTEAPDDVTEIPAPTESPDDIIETPAPTKAPTVSDERSTIPRITVLPEEKIWYADDGTTLLTVTDFTLSIDGNDFGALQTAFNSYHPGIIDEEYQSLYEGAIEHYDFDPDYFWGYSSNFSAQLSRCDSSVISLRVSYSDYTGGAHGMYSYGGETYDVATGELLKLSDLVADTEGFYPNAIDYINNALYEEYEDGLFADYQSWVAESLSPDKESLWYMTAAGIVICFTPYEVGPYAMGAPEILLPYSEFAVYLHAKYAPTDEETVAKIGLNQDISEFVGSERPIMIEAINNDWFLDISLVSGDNRIFLGTFGYFSNAYVIKRADNRSFVMITCDYMSDDYVTFLYEVTNGNLIKCNELPNMLPTGRTISSKNAEMEVRIDALGSYRGFANFLLSPDGQLVHDGELYQIDSLHTLNIIKPLPVTLEGADHILDTGVQIVITGTNLVDEIYFKVVNTEQTGTIHYTRNESESWIIYIDGISEYEYFDSLPYAG